MFMNNDTFYPTPKYLVKKMINKLPKSLREYKYILEPSCGKGNIIEYTKEIYKEMYGGSYYKEVNPDKYLTFDAVEQDKNLIDLCRGKGINIIWNDFLTLDPPRFYDLILMNPPFINGEKHLLKAISIEERTGGSIVCILNAETIKNPYSNNRQTLINKLNEYNANIEYIEQAFSDAERKTDVEIALIYLEIPMINTESMFEKEFKREHIDLKFDDFNSLAIKMNPLEKLVFEYNMVKKATISLYKEKMRVDKLLQGFSIDSFVTLKENDLSSQKPLSINDFIEKLNLKFWNKFIEISEFKKKLPTKLRDTFQCDMQKQKNIAFTIENLQYFYEELMKQIPKSYEETVYYVFSELTNKYNYSESSYNKNVHYISGWKTNKICKIVGKNIIPLYHDFLYKIPDVLYNLNIIFQNLSGEIDDINTPEILNKIKNCEKNIETKFFILNSYQKTLHIKYKDKELLKKFNYIACKGSNNLPPNFGTKHYRDMTNEEKELVKFFDFEPIEFEQINNNNYIKLLN